MSITSTKSNDNRKRPILISTSHNVMAFINQTIICISEHWSGIIENTRVWLSMIKWSSRIPRTKQSEEV